MSLAFQVQVGNNNIASRSYNGVGPISRAEGKRLLDEIYEEACRYYSSLRGRQDFRDAIADGKRQIDNAVGGVDAGQNRAFYRRQFATNLGYLRVDIEIYRGSGHFRS